MSDQDVIFYLLPATIVVLCVLGYTIRECLRSGRDIPYVPRHDVDGDAEALADPDHVVQQPVRRARRNRGGQVHHADNPIRRIIG
ncbi:MAG: hypothetical protein GC159_15420 [Phycisphaera sp.]|nr:hypothetical protein [Phycisphaera sp.]